MQDQAEVGHVFGHERPQRWQDADVRRRKRADRELPGMSIGSLLREPPGMLDARENVFRLLQEDASRIGQRDVLPATVEQFRADRFFQLAYLLAQRRLSRAKSCRCAREAELFGDRHEVA